MSYADFIAGKTHHAMPVGISAPPTVSSRLFPFQADCVRWALQRGRAALFADCGLGKGPMALEWARIVAAHAGGRVLVLAPLAVAQQFIREGEKFGIPIAYAREQSEVAGPLTVTNYERLERFDPSAFAGVVLDESSILKSFNGATRNQIIESFAATPFRLACTATPSPNDFMELGNHAEFLGVMTRTEMLSRYFVHDGGTTQDWRLKGHAEGDFWRWVCSWAAMIRKPSDLGYSDDGFELPPLEITEHVCPVNHVTTRRAGMLFAMEARTLQEQRVARRASLDDRVARTAALANGDDEQWIVWCDLNDEGDALAAAIPGSVQVSGADAPEFKIAAAEWFQGLRCLCGSLRFSGKLTACGSENTKKTGSEESHPTLSTPLGSADTGHQELPPKTENTCAPTTSGTKTSSSSQESNWTNETASAGSDTERTPPSASRTKRRSKSGKLRIPESATTSGCESTGSPQSNLTDCSQVKAEDAPSAVASSLAIDVEAGFTSTTTTLPAWSGECSAPTATSGSGSLETTQIGSIAQPCTCGYASGRRVLVSKVSIFGFGMNLQCCRNVAFVGLSHSYESLYQAVRRVYRFGQTRTVHVHIITSELEGRVVENIRRKEAQHESMAREMLGHMRDIQRDNIRATGRTFTGYEPAVAMRVPSWLSHYAAQVEG